MVSYVTNLPNIQFEPSYEICKYFLDSQEPPNPVPVLIAIPMEINRVSRSHLSFQRQETQSCLFVSSGKGGGVLPDLTA